MDGMSVAAHDAQLSVEIVNARHWPSRRLARRLARNGMRPVETALLARYGEELSGDVLQLGARGDDLTRALVHHARTLTGIGVSTPTVEVCRELHPTGCFEERNIVDLDGFEAGRFSAIVAGHFALDLLGDADRRWVLSQLNRILADDGVLLFSSHNLACESLVRKPGHHAVLNPLRLWKLPRLLRNRTFLTHLQQREHGYALLNDHGHDYSLLSYYISRDAQERQLFRADLRLLECVTLDDEPVERGDIAYGSRELYYAAQPLLARPRPKGEALA
jgi:SAM-dependent methyltransferase